MKLSKSNAAKVVLILIAAAALLAAQTSTATSSHADILRGEYVRFRAVEVRR
ncbi:MAG: hypothetical protein ABJB40_02955 [Acidobacteriota bacterium]